VTKTFIRTVLSTLFVLAMAGAATAEKYNVDKVHSTVGFSVTHLQLSEVDGRFKDFSGEVSWDPKAPAKSSISFTVQAKSVSTDNDKRDEHLRGSDFFDVDKYPTLTFKSTKISPLGEDRYSILGDLTMHGVTKPVTASATIKGPLDAFKDGNLSLGFRATFKLNRIDFKVGDGWKGGSDSVVGHDVFVTIKGEAHQAK
jgi:polyisoprenoid-binding protein YceI